MEKWNTIHKRWIRLAYLLMIGICVSLIAPVDGVNAQNTDRAKTGEYTALLNQQMVFRGVTTENNLLSLNFNNIGLSEALNTLAREVQVGLAFNAGLTLNKKVTIQLERVTVYEALERILSGTGLEAKIPDSRDIIFIKKKKADIQLETVTGTVTSADNGEPLPGVNVVVKGTTTGTSTDQDGEYRLNVPSLQDTLVFSFIGYQTQQVPINGRTTINVTLSLQTISGEELVVVGYGQQQVRNLTGSVNSVNSEKLQEITVSNSSQLLQGQLPGVITKQTSGLPGEDNAGFSIRGFGNPLVLVDGVERNLSNVDPNNIESISVLKDASAAIYGARSGNGVVLITTKRGTEGRPKFDYEGTYSVQQFTNKPQVITDAGIYTEFWREAELNMGVSPTYTEEEIQKYKNRESGYESYDWYDFAFKDWTPMQKHNLSVNGGNKDLAYYAGLGFTDQQSMISSNDFFYNRYNVRSNVDANITEHLTTKVDFNFAYEFQRKVPQDGGSSVGQIMRGVYKSQPMAPTSFPDTSLTPTSNLLGTHNRLYGAIFKDIRGFQDLERNILTGDAEINYETPFVDGLNLNVGLTYQSNKLRDNQFDKDFELYRRDPESGNYSLIGVFGANNKNRVSIRDREFNRIKGQFQVEYQKDLKDHSFEGLFLGEYIHEGVNQVFSQSENLLSDELPYLNFGDPKFSILNQFVRESSRGSFAGRVKYSYKSRYLLEGTFRYDASSVFPPNGRWGFFPSVSAGWLISEEDFFQNLLSSVSYAKIRASYSETGYDQNAIPYDYFTGYNVLTNPPFLFGSTQFRRLRSGSLPNEDMTWENMTIYNLGLEFDLFEGSLAFEIDGFYRKRTNILATPQRSFPSTFGASLPLDNLNSSDDRGFDLMITHNGNIGEFGYNISGNVTYARSKWIHFEEEDFQTEVEQRIFQNSGKWRNRAVGYVSDGLFRSQQEIDNHPIDQDQNGNTSLIPGDIKYKDLDGDGVITFRDQKEIGYGTGEPDLNFGLRLGTFYKNFNLSVLLQGASMFSGNVSGLARRPFDNASTPFEFHWEERFHPEKNPDGSLPSVTLGVRQNNNRFSDFWLKQITYVRLENVRLGYAMPTNVVSKLGVRKMQAYISGNNLAVVSNLGIYSNSFDPEAPLSQNNYPPNRTITLGVNIGF